MTDIEPKFIGFIPPVIVKREYDDDEFEDEEIKEEKDTEIDSDFDEEVFGDDDDEEDQEEPIPKTEDCLEKCFCKKLPADFDKCYVYVRCGECKRLIPSE